MNAEVRGTRGCVGPWHPVSWVPQVVVAWQPGPVPLPHPGAGQDGGQFGTERLSRKIYSDDICLRKDWEIKSVGPG